MNIIYGLLLSFSMHAAFDGVEISRYYIVVWARAVARLFEALRYMPEGHGLKSPGVNAIFH